MEIQMSGDDCFKQAKDLMIAGKDLDKAFEMFNLLYNETCRDNKNIDIILFHLASVCMKRKQTALSLLLFKEALKYRENFIEAINNLGYIYKQELMHKEAIESFEKVVALMEKFPDHVGNDDKADYLTNLGSMYVANGTAEKAIEYFNKSLAFNASNVQTRWNKSLAHLEMGDYRNGFREYEFGERVNRFKDRNYGMDSLPFWKGTPQQTVIVIGEQGLGDEIMFASMVPDLMKDCRVILDAHPRLADLFRRSFPEIPVYGTRKSEKLCWHNFHKIDAKIGMGSLGKFYRNKESDFPAKPYIKADPKIIEKYAKRFAEMGDKPKIGISWLGGNKETNKSERYIALDKWKDLFALDLDFISLQYNKGIGKEVAEFEKKNNICLNHWQDTIDDYDETAGLLANLDLIISVPQSVVHLAGAMGVLTWQLTPFKSLWQCGEHGKDMPWYSSVKNYWQDENGLWEPVMEKIKGELCNLLQMSIAS